MNGDALQSPAAKRPRPRRRTWRHLAVSALLCIVAGILVNTIVAWKLCTNAQQRVASKGYGSSDLQRWRETDAPTVSALRLWWNDAPVQFRQPPQAHFVRYGKHAVVQIVGARIKDAQDSSRWDLLQVVEGGWPTRCLRGEAWLPDQLLQSTSANPAPWFAQRVIALRPIAGPFIYNVIILGSIPFLIYAAIQLVIAAHRVWRELQRRWKAEQARLAGCCPVCRYELRGELSRGCPECGWNRSERAGV